jgi:hypothetical protein
MQVLYGLRDMFDPEYLSDPRVASVVPAGALQWYRSAQGQWFRDILAPNILSDQARQSHDPRLQVFRAATLSNAEILGLGGDIGSVQTGKLANLLLLRADPSRTVDAYVEIVKVIVHGRVLDPADLTADRHGTM